MREECLCGSGQIVGSFADTAVHGFLATPIQVAVPEPASIALFGAGIFGLALMRRRRRA